MVEEGRFGENHTVSPVQPHPPPTPIDEFVIVASQMQPWHEPHNAAGTGRPHLVREGQIVAGHADVVVDRENRIGVGPFQRLETVVEAVDGVLNEDHLGMLSVLVSVENVDRRGIFLAPYDVDVFDGAAGTVEVDGICSVGGDERKDEWTALLHTSDRQRAITSSCFTPYLASTNAV